jgi:hypothetical protein
LVSARPIAFCQRVGHLALLDDAGDDRRAAFLEFAQVGEPLLERAQLRVVEAAGRFLAIAGDERNGRTLVEQLDRGADLFGAALQLGGDASLDDGSHLALGRAV